MEMISPAALTLDEANWTTAMSESPGKDYPEAGSLSRAVNPGKLAWRPQSWRLKKHNHNNDYIVYNDMKHTSTLNVHIMCTCFGIHFANWIRHWQVAHLGDLFDRTETWWLCRNCKLWQVFITKESHQFLWDSWNTLDIKMRHLHYDSSKSPPSERLSLCWSPHYCLKRPDWSCSRKSQCTPNISGYIKSLQWKMDKHASFVDYELV